MYSTDIHPSLEPHDMEHTMDLPTKEIDVLSALSNQMADAVEQIAPSLVLINGRQRYPASGIVLATDTVLTADHILEREDDLTILTHDSRTLSAQFVGRDSATDVAVLHVANLGLEPAVAANMPRVGQFVLAVGRPSSDGPMASIGIVSAIGGPLRTTQGAMLERYIRTDATPYPGFSGGPLINTRGAVLGMTTTGLVNSIAFAVPSEIAWKIAETITEQGYVKRGYLGISCQPVPLPPAQRTESSQEVGLLVVRVEDDSPAEHGGLLLGDILIALDGQSITDTDDLQALLTGERVDAPVAVDIIRGGVRQKLQVTIGQRKRS